MVTFAVPTDWICQAMQACGTLTKMAFRLTNHIQPAHHHRVRSSRRRTTTYGICLMLQHDMDLTIRYLQHHGHEARQNIASA